jgi:HD-GYP domain-containing protein (c-di-GMP phosphodiesterase class II)
VRRSAAERKDAGTDAGLSFARMESTDPAAPRPPSTDAGKRVPTDRDLQYDYAVQEVGRILTAARDSRPFSVGTLQRIMGAMANTLAGGDDRLLLQAMETGHDQVDLPGHMVNTAIFAVKIGQGAGCSDEELPWLALAGSLHDLGMVILPSRILEKPESLSDEERALVRHHPEKGFRLLQALGSEYEWLSNVALQEHEREDGSGYPRGLKGDEIHDFSKIVGLADVYEALTHGRPYRQMRVAFDVVKELISSERSKFPDRLLKGFIRGLSTFPVGSYVRLNSQEIARIISTNPAFPLRPVVEIVAGPKAEPLASPRQMDLSNNTLLYITEAYSPALPESPSPK